MPAYLKDLEDYEEVELVETVRLGNWTQNPFNFLMALAADAFATEAVLSERVGLSYNSARLFHWRRDLPEFRPLELAIKNSPEAAARFLARYSQPQVVVNALRVLGGGGKQGERVTEAAKILLDILREPIIVRRPRAKSLLAQYLQPSQLERGENLPVEAEFMVVLPQVAPKKGAEEGNGEGKVDPEGG